MPVAQCQWVIGLKLTANAKRSLYCALILPYLQYCNICWGNTFKTHLDRIFKLQKRILRIIAQTHYLAHTQPLFKKFKLLNINQLNNYHTGSFIYRYLHEHESIPASLQSLFILNNQIHNHHTRSANKIHLPKTRTVLRQQFIRYAGAKLWNSLPKKLTSASSLYSFKFHLKNYLLTG